MLSKLKQRMDVNQEEQELLSNEIDKSMMINVDAQPLLPLRSHGSHSAVFRSPLGLPFSSST